MAVFFLCPSHAESVDFSVTFQFFSLQKRLKSFEWYSKFSWIYIHVIFIDIHFWNKYHFGFTSYIIPVHVATYTQGVVTKEENVTKEMKYVVFFKLGVKGSQISWNHYVRLYSCSTFLKGWYAYHTVWISVKGDISQAEMEPSNTFDKSYSNPIRGRSALRHFKKWVGVRLTKTIFYFLKCFDNISCRPELASNVTEEMENECNGLACFTLKGKISSADRLRH